MTSNNALAHGSYGHALLMMDDFDGPIYHFQNAIGLRVGAGRTGDFLGLGIAFSRQDKVGEAKWALGPEAELVPDSLEIRFELGKILLGEEDFAGAIEQFSRLVEIDSGNAAARINLAIALSRSGESDNARATLWRGPPAESRQS